MYGASKFKNGHRVCEVSLISGAIVAGATAATVAATVATVGAGVMAAGKVLGIKEAAPIGGLMMAGGGLMSGAAGLGMLGGAATATGTLGTLSAGAQLVGGALQGVGILTGNDKLAGIGGLINVAGMAGTSISNMPDAAASSGGGVTSGKVAGSSGGMDVGGATDYSVASAPNAPSSGTGLRMPKIGDATPVTTTTAEAGNIFDKIQKYDKLIERVGNFASGVTGAQQKDQELALKQQELDMYRQTRTAAPVSGRFSTRPATTVGQVARPAVPGYSTGLLNSPLGA